MSGKKAKQERREATREVVDWLRPHLNRLRGEFARRLKLQRQDFPKMKLPCETCAFRTSADFTDGDDGFIGTTIGVVDALARGEIFYCHQPATPESAAIYGDTKYQPRRNEKLDMLEPCAGWWVLNSTTPEPLNVWDFFGEKTTRLFAGCVAILNGKEAKP